MISILSINNLGKGVIGLAFLLCTANVDAMSTQNLIYARSPVDNPLKGLVPYAGDKNHLFPHSLEFSYLPLSALVIDKEKYDWTPLENLLNAISQRGHQTVFRVYMEYPKKKSAIPAYLIEQGLKVHSWHDEEIHHRTPDYSNPLLRECLQHFIIQLGQKYDGDPRIGYITAGLLGLWGEWHTYPRSDLWASQEVQKEILDAYESAFHTTPILLRYPAGENHPAQVANAKRSFGYHDDSFAWATLHTGKKEDEWYFVTALQNAGVAALNKWKRFPIGGEIRPEAWGKVFDKEPEDKRIQNFKQCVEQTHVTWLMDTGMFQEETWSSTRRTRANDLVRKMGYEFHIPKVSWSHDKQYITISLEIENRGVAPFYYKWPLKFAVLSKEGRILKVFQSDKHLANILPSNSPYICKEQLKLEEIDNQPFHLALQVSNPLPKGKPIRFANKSQDAHALGWLTLFSVNNL